MAELGITPIRSAFLSDDEALKELYSRMYNQAAAQGADTKALDKAFNLDTSAKGTTGADGNWWDSIKGSFTPNENGYSTAGSMLGGTKTAVDILSGLAGAYYTKKNFDLEKEAEADKRKLYAQADANTAKFAQNAGGGASYAGSGIG